MRSYCFLAEVTFNNKKLNPIVTELFIRGRKLNSSLAFITQSYFSVPKNIRLTSMLYFIIKFRKKRELQQIDNPSDNRSCFRKNLLYRI